MSFQSVALPDFLFRWIPEPVLNLMVSVWVFFLLIPCCIGTFHSCKCISFSTLQIYIFEQKGERTACNFSHPKVRFPARVTYLRSFYCKTDRNALSPGNHLTILRNVSQDLVNLKNILPIFFNAINALVCRDVVYNHTKLH